MIGVACGALAFVPLAFGVRALRRRHFGYLEGPVAVLAGVTLAYAIVVCEAQLLGTIGLFRIGALVVAYGGTGVALMLKMRETGTATPTSSTPATSPRRGRAGLVALVVGAVLAAQWMVRTTDSLRRGMVTTADSMWYHMPVAARFVQTGWTTHLHYSDANSLTVFFPSSSELVHAIGVAFMRTDVLSPMLNMAWLALALLAAWCVGRPYGVAPLTFLGAAIVLALPEIWLDDAGSALNDVVGLAMLLTAVALLFHLKPTSRDGTWRSSLLLCSGLAGGAALGTKYTLIPAVGALTVTLVLAARRGSRWRAAGFWLLGLAITGSYWYLRNLLVVGNPLPSVRLGIGPLHLPEVPFAGSQKLIDYLFDGRAWHRFFLPGLRDAFGPLWWALFALAFTGFVAGVILARDRLVKMVAVVGATAFVAYIVGPQILGYGSYLFQFAVNVRYAAPAIVLGLMALPIAARQLGRRATLVVLVAYAVMFVATQFDPTIWGNRRVLIASPTSGAWPRVFGIVFGVVVLVAALVLRQQPDWWHAIVSPRLTTVGVIAVVLVVFGGYFLQESYQRNRYTESPLFPTISQWARETQDARIAVVGTNSQYPLYGRDLSNYVQYVARRGADHQSSRFATCRSWRRALNAGRYDYLVATSPGYPFPTKSRALEIEWTRSDPAARVLSQTSSDRAQIVLFKLDGRMHPDACT